MSIRITLEFDSYAEALDAIGSLANIPNDQAGKTKPAPRKKAAAKKSGNGKSKPAPQAAPEPPAPVAPPSPVSEAPPAAAGPEVDVSDTGFAKWLNERNRPENHAALVDLLTRFGVNRGSALSMDQRREFIQLWDEAHT